MNLESILEDMDDDLQILENNPACEPSPNNPASEPSPNIPTVGVTTSNKNKSRNDDKDAGETKKPRPNASEVWEYFDRVGLIDGIEKCKCKGCGNLYTCRSSSGTTHLKRHITICLKTPKYHDVGTLLDSQATILKKWKFDSRAYRDALARAIIMHDLPFSFAQYEGICAVNKVLNPDFKPISRNTANADCKSVFLSEKAKLKNVMANIPGRICLTSDVWTAVTVQGYMAVTAHFVDGNFKLNSKLLAFCELDKAHTGLELSGKLLEVLKDWGIDGKVFSLTLDNATSNDKLEKILKRRLNLQNGLLCNGEYYHIRCCAHVLNLIVQDGLKAAGDALHKIRESVKYVKASEGRLRQFRICVEEVHLNNVGGGFLRLDVATRWNATYIMLESAIKYRRAFANLSYHDRNYMLCPTNEEWERAEKLHAFLAPYYNITNLMSGSSYPTSNLYFVQVAMIEMGLNENITSEDVVIQEMASEMKKKFNKYWKNYSITLALGCVVDPKAKLNFIRWCYKRLYPCDYEERVNKVKKGLYDLFGEYVHKVATSSSSLTSSSTDIASHPMSSGICTPSILEEYHQEMKQKTSSVDKSQLDIYLEEACIVENYIDVLQYWKLNKHRFPQLAIMACDILSIPITTVASESSFSIGGRILHKYRNCLLPETVQSLICTRNWMHDFKEVGPSDMQEVEEIQLFTEHTSQGNPTSRTDD